MNQLTFIKIDTEWVRVDKIMVVGPSMIPDWGSTILLSGHEKPLTYRDTPKKIMKRIEQVMRAGE